MIKLETPLRKAIRTTGAYIRKLKDLKIETVSDFLRYFPRGYTDERDVRKISDIEPGIKNTVKGTVRSIHTASSWGRRIPITTVLLSDESGNVEAVWFNQAYLARTLQVGQGIILSGKVKYDSRKGRIFFQNPAFEIIRPKQIHTGRIVPLYHETEGISSKWLREKLFSLLPASSQFAEFLPQEILRGFRLMTRGNAISSIHFPKNPSLLDSAKRRLAFEELFLLQLAALFRKNQFRAIANREKKQIPVDWELIKRFRDSLPWSLTNAQKKSIYEIIRDLEKPYPMSRLLEGDTGSGKTVVAAAAVLHAVESGFQACFLAPTEILARQHGQTFAELLKHFEIAPQLLLGATPEKEKRKISEKLRSHEIKFVIGTHALIQESIGFKNLGLAIIDEQHRFGVKQREKLKTYGSPHVLSLTATPIPRTLALILYGDQDLSVLDEMPPGRQKIITRVVPEEKRKEAYAWILKEIEKGRQAFIIFPLIEESEVLQVKAATKEFERLSKEIFPKLSVGLLHGQLASKEKEETMQQFSKGKVQILVSTAVVEVGVDVPNATIMMIEGAERFGLAQLHQFRGRVGRGAEQSYCFLFPTHLSQTDPLQKINVLKRLNALVKYDSGFKLAKVDLDLRGPGAIYGVAQSGIPDLKMAMLSDAKTIHESRSAAEMILDTDSELKKYPELRRQIENNEKVAIDY